MKVVKTQKDDLNAVLTLTLDRGDFQPKVEEVLEPHPPKDAPVKQNDEVLKSHFRNIVEF